MGYILFITGWYKTIAVCSYLAMPLKKQQQQKQQQQKQQQQQQH